jgi:transposase
MFDKSKDSKSPDDIVRDIKRKNRRKFNAEEKIRIILEGLKGEDTIKELCRKEGLHQTQYYKWSKIFLEAGKQRLNGDVKREADSEEVKELRKENEDLKQCLAEIALKNRLLKKTLKGLD